MLRLPACAALSALVVLSLGCSREGGSTSSVARVSPPVETPSQAFMANATNRLGPGAYATVAEPVVGREAAQLIWLGERRLAFMRHGDATSPPEFLHVERDEDGWSSPLAAMWPGVRLHALLDGTVLSGERPMALVLADDTDWATVLGLRPGGPLAEVVSDAEFQRMEDTNRRLFTSLLIGGRWTRPLPIPGTRGALQAVLAAGAGGRAVVVFSLDRDADRATRGDRDLHAAFFDGTRWLPPFALTRTTALEQGVAVVYAGSAYHVAWVRDADGSLDTQGDRTVWTARVAEEGTLAAGPAALAGTYQRPWPVLGAVGETPVLLFSGDAPDRQLRPLLESRYEGGWTAPRDTGLKTGPIVRGRLLSAEGETLLVYEDSNALGSAMSRGGEWHSAGYLQDFNARAFSLAEADYALGAAGLSVAVLGRAGQEAGGGVVLATRLPIAADLAVTVAAPTARRWQVGESLELQLTVENRGQLASGPFSLSVRDGEATLATSEVSEGLFPGERKRVSLSVTPARSRQVLVVAATGTRAELELENNRFPLTLEAKPDFAVEGVSREGNALVARVVDRRGVGTSPVNVDFVLMKDGEQQVLHQTTFDPNVALPVRFEWTGWPAAHERYVVSVRVNDRTPVLEDDTGNNLGTWAHEPAVDFVISALEVRGGKVRATVANVGAAPASRVQLLLTTDADAAVAEAPSGASLFSGEVDISTGSGEVELPATVLDGTSGYFLYGVVNPYGTVAEPNRDNNMARVSKRPVDVFRPALFALEALRVHRDAQVYGPVAVRADGPADEEVVLGPAARVEGDVYGQRVRLLPNTQVQGMVRHNGLVLGPRASHAGAHSPLELPLEVEVPEVVVEPGTAPVRVTGTQQLPPGSYGEVKLGARAVLRLSGGHYALGSLGLATRARLECEAACEVEVAGAVDTASEVYMGPVPAGGPPAEEVRLRSAGQQVRLGEGALVRAEVQAPAARLEVGARARVEGRLMARVLEVGHAAVVRGQDELAAATRLDVTVQSEARSARAK